MEPNLFLANGGLPLAESCEEPPKGSANESRSGSRREDVSGDLSPSISFSAGGQREQYEGHNMDTK